MLHSRKTGGAWQKSHTVAQPSENKQLTPAILPSLTQTWLPVIIFKTLTTPLNPKIQACVHVHVCVFSACQSYSLFILF